MRKMVFWPRFEPGLTRESPKKSMPIYEYEPVDHDCQMCPNRIEVIQGVNEEPLTYCPQCGLDVRRVVSCASFKVGVESSPEQAGKKGFTTWKRVEKGRWEKVAGPGVDVLVGNPDDIAQVEAEKAPPPKVLDLDQTDA